jgi:hypothetical protein
MSKNKFNVIEYDKYTVTFHGQGTLLVTWDTEIVVWHIIGLRTNVK